MEYNGGGLGRASSWCVEEGGKTLPSRLRTAVGALTLLVLQGRPPTRVTEGSV
jgi:hypothetical protein